MRFYHQTARMSKEIGFEIKPVKGCCDDILLAGSDRGVLQLGSIYPGQEILDWAFYA